MNVNTIMNYAILLGSSTNTLMLLPEYYDQLADRKEVYLTRIDEDLWHSIDKGPCRDDLVQAVGTQHIMKM